MNNSEKYTLITGASEGLGKALATEFASHYYNLLLVALPDSNLEKFTKELKDKYNINAFYFTTDLTCENAPYEIFNWAKTFGYQVENLINNAGAGYLAPFSTLETAFPSNLIKLNVQALVTLTHLFIPEIKKNGNPGHILNVGSLASFYSIPNKAIYSASKSFVLNFSRAIREELKKDHIQVSCLCPGPILPSNGVNNKKYQKESSKATLLSLTPEQLSKITVKQILQNKGLIIPSKRLKFLVFLSKMIPKSIQPKIINKFSDFS